MTKGGSRKGMHTALLVTVLGVGALELVASAAAYRATISETDLQDLAKAVTELPLGALRLGTPWLRPRVLQYVNTEHALGLVAPDESGLAKVWVIVAEGQTPTELALPKTPTRVQAFGGLELLEYELDLPLLRVDLLESDALKVSADGRPCRTKRGKTARAKDGQTRSARARRWDCRPGELRTDIVEVAYSPRRCLAGDALAGRLIRLELPKVDEPGLLRAHLGFGDFNARLRSDGQIAIRVMEGDQTRASFLVSDDQGWHPFEVELAGGAPLSIELEPSDSGTYGADGQARPRPPHTFCFEARVLDSVSEGTRR